MIRFEDSTENDRIFEPWVFDQIRVTGKVTVTGDHVEFSVPGRWLGEFRSGPNLHTISRYAAKIFGPGCYGLAFCRRIGFQQEIDQ